MVKKLLYFLLIAFTVQLITACRPQCGEQQIYETHYNGLTIIPYDLSGFNPKPITDSVYKNAFGLTVGVNFEQIQVAETKPFRIHFFNTALALSDCDGPQYIYPDPIQKAELFSTDIQTGIKNNVSKYFVIQGYTENEMITLEQFFKERAEWHDGFQFELEYFDSIPNSTIFSAEVYLKSGTIFMRETEQINFFTNK